MPKSFSINIKVIQYFKVKALRLFYPNLLGEEEMAFLQKQNDRQFIPIQWEATE